MSENEWLVWAGGDCPVPGEKVDLVFRATPDVIDVTERPERLRWSHMVYGDGMGDIVAYRRHPQEIDNATGE